MAEETVTFHVLIEGRVQGVGYRAWCAEAAISRGLSGWVRNRRSGAVEAVITGPRDIVSDMLDAVRTGPRWARVTAVRDLAPVEPSTGPFEIRETA